MRITTQMLAETARKSGIPINQTTLLDVINSEDSSGNLLSGVKKNSKDVYGTSAAANRFQKDSYRKLEKSADSLKDCASKLSDVSGDSLFQKAEEKQDTKELTSEIEKMVDAYNQTLEQLKKSGGAMNEFYREELKNLAGSNAEPLKAVGITQSKDGSLKVDSKVLEKADLASLKQAVGSASDFTKKVGYVSGRVSANASANADSLSSRYNAGGSSFFGLPGMNHFDFLG